MNNMIYVSKGHAPKLLRQLPDWCFKGCRDINVVDPGQMHCNLKDGHKLTIEIINIKERRELGTNCLAT